ncbi:hypothetical protein ACFX2H_002807 [Malus domestica]
MTVVFPRVNAEDESHSPPLNYGVIGRDRGCKHCNCLPPPSNTYNRGCKKDLRCRDEIDHKAPRPLNDQQ